MQSKPGQRTLFLLGGDLGACVPLQWKPREGRGALCAVECPTAAAGCGRAPRAFADGVDEWPAGRKWLRHSFCDETTGSFLGVELPSLSRQRMICKRGAGVQCVSSELRGTGAWLFGWSWPCGGRPGTRTPFEEPLLGRSSSVLTLNRNAEVAARWHTARSGSEAVKSGFLCPLDWPS